MIIRLRAIACCIFLKGFLLVSDFVCEMIDPTYFALFGAFMTVQYIGGVYLILNFLDP
jgi:hypothetical protein